MAGDWIKMRTNLDTDPRIIELAETLGLPELQVVGCLWKLWAWADGHTLDGNALRVTCVTLDRFTAVTGFADALRKVGWLEGRDGALSFPRFAEHNGQTAKNRAETNKRVAKHRNAIRVTDVTEKPLPEKRREEKRRKSENKQKELAEEFSKWYSVYPRRTAKGAAYAAYCKAVKRIATEHGIDLASAVDRLQAWTLERVPQIESHEMQYRKQPATWLNQECYSDEFTPRVSRVATLEDMEAWSPK